MRLKAYSHPAAAPEQFDQFALVERQPKSLRPWTTEVEVYITEIDRHVAAAMAEEERPIEEFFVPQAVLDEVEGEFDLAPAN